MADQIKGPAKRAMPVKIKDEVLGGVYANNMMVGHTREEFVMDFIYAFPRGGVVNARVITSPGHMKRIISALKDNLQKYEQRFGQIKEASEPKQDLIVN
ncbi:MAG: DUF3467 domain-containing protein [Deltaproteobacteria bacterium]|nr:DUF3467 domain-containing protein [Deltaproteobacteria bacterium]